MCKDGNICEFPTISFNRIAGTMFIYNIREWKTGPRKDDTI